MKLLEGKSDKEKKQLIAAAILGFVALFTLYVAFGRGGGTTTATVKVTVTPKPTASPSAVRTDATLPTVSEQDFTYQTTEVVYPGSISAPDAGRNIFAFYEPPEKCKGDQCPSPPPPPPTPIKSPTPVPSPPILIASFNPQMVYAGARGFRLELNGDKFTPDSHIYFNQTELPTTFVNTQKLIADVSSKFISGEGAAQIIVQTPDGKLFSNSMIMSVQAPPKPALMYIGMIGHKGYNNDKAILADNDKAPPFSARLNDVVAGRFRLIEIAPAEVTFEDTALGFKHRVPITKGAFSGSGSGAAPGKGSDITDPSVQTYPPGFIPQNIPGIPGTVQQYNPQEQRKMEMQKQKEDVDDEGDG